ncbi:MAG TPA: protein phosphatase 2C domain-containing protein [Vicinamibacterales bacterium]|jgi:serine/threonine protein phosphatase PrpC|nr:protein phosphatase 2C domain-containing protein [Vicinamibacterales bacterium]
MTAGSAVLAPLAGLLHAACRSDPGRVRANNEDLPIVDAARGVYGVIDGVGGQAAGEIAAAIAHDVIVQRLSRPLGTPAERVREAIALANNEIFRRSERAPEFRGMTCVVTLALVVGDQLTIGHVGDSRLYTVGPTGLRKLTHDHSPVGEREDACEITEAEAMQHPRRNEVFRDVGGALHDKDDADFVEVIDERLERDTAILVCTDGLTDMVASLAIEQIVRRHAGQPQRVVDALIDAANEAGGRDNVTVVYAETPGFAESIRGGSTGVTSAPGVAAVGPSRVSKESEAPSRSVLRSIARGLAAFGRWVVGSRTTWFAAGALAGVLAALMLVWRVGNPDVTRARTLVVNGSGGDAFARIDAALGHARAGDLVRVEPGVYAERIVVPDGVDVVARVSGSVTLRRPAGTQGDWVAITTTGTLGGRLVGMRIESSPETPIDVAIRIAGQGRTIELMDVSGPVRAAVEVLAASSVVLRGNVLAVPGPAVWLDDGAQATLTNNIVMHVGRARAVPVMMAETAQATLSRNVFAGFASIGAGSGGPAGSADWSKGNFVVGAEPAGAR